MFAGIHRSYDFLNHFLSFGADYHWRRVLSRRVVQITPAGRVLDLATGTGDVVGAISRCAEFKGTLTGVDFCAPMLEVARRKWPAISFVQADAMALPFEEGQFDCVTVAFGVRNFESLEKGLEQIARVLKPGGHLLVLEFSKPVRGLRPFYWLYLHGIIPLLASVFCRDQSAYQYLGSSIEEFPDQDAFCRILQRCGFEQVQWTNLTFGIVAIHHGVRTVSV